VTVKAVISAKNGWLWLYTVVDDLTGQREESITEGQLQLVKAGD